MLFETLHSPAICPGDSLATLNSVIANPDSYIGASCIPPSFR